MTINLDVKIEFIPRAGGEVTVVIVGANDSVLTFDSFSCIDDAESAADMIENLLETMFSAETYKAGLTLARLRDALTPPPVNLAKMYRQDKAYLQPMQDFEELEGAKVISIFEDEEGVDVELEKPTGECFIVGSNADTICKIVARKLVKE